MFFIFKSYFKDIILKRLFKNSAILLSGNIVSSIISFISIALTARALGPEQFGILVLINTYVLIIDKLINFQSWRAIIKYGAEALESKGEEEFKGLIKLGTIIDVCSAIIGTIVAIIVVHVVGQWRGWNNDIHLTSILYSLIILFRLSGTPTAVLRLFNEFKLFAYRSILASSFKLAGVTILLYLDIGLIGFTVLWAITDILGQLTLLSAGWKVLKKHGIVEVFNSDMRKINQKFRGFWKFVWTTNIDSSVSVGREIDVFIIGAVLSLEAVALFKIAKQISSVLLRIIDPMYSAIYPELSKLIAVKDKTMFVNLIKKSSFILGTILVIPFVLFLMIGNDLLVLFLGYQYIGAFKPAVYCVMAMVVWAFAQPLAPAMLSIGKPQTSFIIHIITTIFYIIAAYFLSVKYGVSGTGASYFLFYFVWTILMFFALYRNLKKIKFVSEAAFAK